MIRRRDMLPLLGGAAITWPLAARAQQGAMPVIGFLNSGSPGPLYRPLAAFRAGLGEAGFAEGRNAAIEYRWAEGRYDQLPGLAADLVHRPVAVLVATGGDVAARAAQAATRTIPIVIVMGSDPVRAGLLQSLGRPGGNVTGAGMFSSVLDAKRLELLRELVPGAETIAVLLNPTRPSVAEERQAIEEAAAHLRVRLIMVTAASDNEIETAFAALVAQRTGALLVGADPLLNDRREKIIALAAQHRLPAVYEWRDHAEAGGLASYGTILTDAYRQIGLYAGRILKGAKPADLPFVQSTRFELVVNLKTAKALGITIPQSILVRADEVIE